MRFLYLAAIGILTPLLAWTIGNRLFFPFILTLPAYPVYYLFLREGKRKRAVLGIFLWAVVLSFTLSVLSSQAPSRAQKIIIKGEAYTSEMIRWVETGLGAEGTPRRFVPQQTIEFLVFLLVSGLSGGFAGLLMGSVLLSYMNCYVGSLLALSQDKLAASLLGWPPWAIIRVLGFIIASLPMSELFFARVRKREKPFRFSSSYLLVAAGLIVLDMVLKALLSPTWRRLLTEAVHGE